MDLDLDLGMALVDKRGSPVLGAEGPDVPKQTLIERIERTHDRYAETTVELSQRQLDTVDLLVQGATLRQVADRHGVTVKQARSDYQVAMRVLNEGSGDRVRDLRDEVTARQRSIIMANMSKARAGDEKAAAIVQKSDSLLAEIWGLRYIKPEMVEPPADPAIASALSVYLAKVAERVSAAS